MFIRSYIIFTILLLTAAICYGQDMARPGMIPFDTISQTVKGAIPSVEVTVSDEDTDRTRRLYDSLEVRSSKRKFWNFMYNSLFSPVRKDTTSSNQIVNEVHIFSEYKGKIIRNISTSRADVFDEGGAWIERSANSLHSKTWDHTIRRDLLFQEGDELDPDILVRTMQLLQSRGYVYDVSIKVLQVLGEPDMVDIVIFSRDNWTISFDGALKAKRRVMGGIYDKNLLGSGNMLSLRANYAYGDGKFWGLLAEWDTPNLWRTFYHANIRFGRDFENYYREILVNKDFILPTDYNIGVKYVNNTERHYQLYIDSTALTKYQSVNVWLGKSLYLDKIKSSIYLAGRYTYTKYTQRPDETGPRFNPAFHDMNRMLYALGLYRENFIVANLIYGYGYKEYLATGYRAEITGGYDWGEFNNDYYLGASFRAGDFSRAGYLAGDISFGSYIDSKTHDWWQSAVDVNLRWFSPLLRKNRTYIRQLIELNYTNGWNREQGADETMRFTREDGPRTMGDYELFTGRRRAVVNTETVFFTPAQPLGFRLVVFGFLDVGLLGNKKELLDNEFFGTIGVGVRLKNERFVFKTIQIRLALALNKTGLIHNQYVRLSTEQRLSEYRFVPSYPQTVYYK